MTFGHYRSLFREDVIILTINFFKMKIVPFSLNTHIFFKIKKIKYIFKTYSKYVITILGQN